MKNDTHKVGKVRSWIEMLIYFLAPLLLVIVFNRELLTSGIGEKSGFLEYSKEVNVFTLLGFMLFIALILERFIEVLINTTRRPDQIKYEARGRTHKQDLDRLEKQSVDVRKVLEELNRLNGKIKGMEKQESSMQSRSLSYSSEEQPKADDRISQIEGDLANCVERKRELSMVVEETFHPLLKEGVKKLYSLKEGNSKPPILMKGIPKLRDEVVTLEEFGKEYGVENQNPSIILANILRVNREMLDHDRNVIANLKVISASYKVETRIIAIRLAFASGILISLIGFRTLEVLVGSLDSVNSVQSICFIWADVMLTGGVIAGGSEGIHKIANVFGSFMDSTSNRLDESGA